MSYHIHWDWRGEEAKYSQARDEIDSLKNDLEELKDRVKELERQKNSSSSSKGPDDLVLDKGPFKS